MTREEYEIVKTRNYLRAIKEAMKTGKIESYDEWFEAIDKAIEVFNEKREAIKAIKPESCGDAVSRQAVLALAKEECDTAIIPYRRFVKDINTLPPVTPQPKIGHCRDCKHWKDSDGVFRRGIGAESHCPINRKEVYEGNGYCFLFENKEGIEIVCGGTS